MLNKFKSAAVLAAATLALTACSSEYEPDTSLPITQQIEDSGVAPYQISEEDWQFTSFGLCNYELFTEFDDVDDAMKDLGMDEVWDESERKTVARVLFANECPNRLRELA